MWIIPGGGIPEADQWFRLTCMDQQEARVRGVSFSLSLATDTLFPQGSRSLRSGYVCTDAARFDRTRLTLNYAMRLIM